MSISVRDLISSLQRLSTKPSANASRKPRRQRRKRTAAQPTPGTQGGPMMAPMGSRKRRSRGRATGGQIASGEVAIRRSELLAELTTDTTGVKSGSAILAPSSLPWLKNLAKAFERCRWQSCVLEYRPAVGASSNGTVAVGFDWGDSDVKAHTMPDGNIVVGLLRAVERVAVLACTPNFDTPVWSRVPSMVIPTARLQSRAWYDMPSSSTVDNIFDQAPGTVVYYAKSSASTTVGEIWVHYSVQLSGTRKV